MRLDWHKYRYFPYEIELARVEAMAVLKPSALREVNNHIELDGVRHPGRASELVYFASFTDPLGHRPTRQSLLEATNGNGGRQSTRYSVHGLHEYKGKFNPQVARALINILSEDCLTEGVLLDPFCGSGTTLIEAIHAGRRAVGLDVNPFAVFLANAKLRALSVDPDQILQEARAAASFAERSSLNSQDASATSREEYLAKWFQSEVLDQIEALREALLSVEEPVQSILLAIASNLLRDYSLQDPTDLRIRRRKTPPPSSPFAERFLADVMIAADKLRAAQDAVGSADGTAIALRGDSRELDALLPHDYEADFAITSPPYATALPYIDTQRLSIVWLGLARSDEIPSLDARLIGSREATGTAKGALRLSLLDNADGLPQEQAEYCLMLDCALDSDDGFRRQAVPVLLYRYMVAMRDSFSAVHNVVKRGGKYALVVGGNHTTLGGVRYNIDTPHHLARLASSSGWRLQELHRLQTYQRYGYHARNAVRSEALVILEAE